MIGIGWAAAEPQLTEKKDEKLMKIEEGRKNERKEEGKMRMKKERSKGSRKLENEKRE